MALFREMMMMMKNAEGTSLTATGAGETDEGAGLEYDWARAADQILHGRCYHSRTHVHHPWSHWYEPGDWDWAATPYTQRHGRGFGGGAPPPTLEELTAWLWTPETTMAFSLLLVVLALFLCCWVSHKIGEFLCTTTAGLSALGLFVVVFFVFLSQWTAV